MEARALPVGRQEFEAWSNRIIAGSDLPADEHSMKGALAGMIMALSPMDAFKEDAYFIKGLRKSASNQVAAAMFEEHRIALKTKIVARQEAERIASEKLKTSEVTPLPMGVTDVVLDKAQV